jgi:hypothetical protein
MTSSHEADWKDWAAEWQGRSSPSPAPAAVGDRIRAHHRRARRVVLAEGALVTAAVGGIVLAVSHAPAPDDLIRGGIVVVLILMLWWLHHRRRPRAAPAARSTADFLEVSVRSRERQLRCLRLAWALIGLELLFLVPWWIDGYRIHGDPFGPVGILTAWAPLAVMAGLLAWTLRLRAGLGADLAALRALRRQLLLDGSDPRPERR